MSKKAETLLTILGPTASGKTQLAVEVAARTDGEIISADSRQVYRDMDIGTGKDLKEYDIDGRHIPYHLIDICQAGEKYNLYRYQTDFLRAYNAVLSRAHIPILCGGSGLYIESVLRNYYLPQVPQNPALRQRLEHLSMEELIGELTRLKQQSGTRLHNTTDIDSAQRAIRAIEIETYAQTSPATVRAFPAIPSIVVGIYIDREQRRDRITRRLQQRMADGMIDEVQSLLASGCTPEELAYYGLEYRYVTEYIMGKYSLEEMTNRLEIAIHQFAKRQMTWFRGMEKRGVPIRWIDFNLPTHTKVSTILNLISQEQCSE